MTQFLFLEKGAQPRESQRAQRDSHDKTVSRPNGPRGPRTDEAPGHQSVLYLMLPTAEGFRLLRAQLVDVGVLPVNGLEAPPVAGPGELALLGRMLQSVAAENGEPLNPSASRPASMPRRRAGAPDADHEYFGEVEIDVRARVVRRAGTLITLAPMEFDLLLALVRHEGAAVARADLLREVWGTTASVSVRTIDTHIATLRRKIETDPANPTHILTVKKVGYRIQR